MINVFNLKTVSSFSKYSILLLLMYGCSSAKIVQDRGMTDSEISHPLAAMFDTSSVFSRNFTGFALYDPEADSMIYAQNADKYFTPASNTKLFTFYTGLKLLPDSLPALDYVINGDSLIFWGTGYPAFLHPDFDDRSVFDFLKKSEHNLYFSDSNFRDDVLGPGWAWGDYQYYYSTERSPFPIYGNVVRLEIEEIKIRQIKSDKNGLKVIPEAFQNKIQPVEDKTNEAFLYRPFFDNHFEYNDEKDTVSYFIDRPFHYTPELLVELLSDTLKRQVTYIRRNKPESTQRIYGISADTLYARMLQPSDNFIAEQILFMSAAEMGKPINSYAAINTMKQKYLNDLKDEPEWVDGSGLSRYNMFTPRSIIQLLQKIDAEFENDTELFRMLPAGGKRGTIQNWYAARDGGEAYIFAKTGTLTHNHNLSGFLITHNGKKLLFSFQNNHYTTSSNVVKSEMEKVLWEIHNRF